MSLCDLVSREIKFGTGQLLLVGGRPSMGKTSFAISIARLLAEQGRKVAYFSLEVQMGKWMEMYDKGDAPRKGPQNCIEIIDDVPQTEESIKSYCEEHKPDLLIIDYLQLIERNHGGASIVVRRLKELADRNSLPIMILTQLSKKIEERNDPSPKADDLCLSGLDVDLFDQVFMLYRPHYYAIEADESELLVIMKDKEERLRWDYDALMVS